MIESLCHSSDFKEQERIYAYIHVYIHAIFSIDTLGDIFKHLNL